MAEEGKRTEHGDEETGVPPQRLYTKGYARKAFEHASKVVRKVSDLIDST